MHCKNSIYSMTNLKNSCYKIRFTEIPLYFLLLNQFLDEIIKAELKFTYFLPTNSLFFVFMFMTDSPFVSLGVPK